MVISLRRIKFWLKFIFLFVVLTCLLYLLFSLTPDLFFRDLNHTPKDEAIRVFHATDQVTTHPTTFTEDVKSRLLLFYQMGE